MIPITQGGTGKSTGLAALNNLAGSNILTDLITSGFNITTNGIIAPSSVTITDPRSLATKEYVDANSGITGIVSIAQGGTGSGDGTDALNALAGGTTLTDLIASGITFSNGGLTAASDIAITDPHAFATKSYVDAHSGVLSTVTVAQGGTGATTGPDALNSLAGNTTLSDLSASGFSFSATGILAPESTVVNNPQSLATKAYVDAHSGVLSTVTVEQGGTGATTGPEALNSLAGNTTLSDMASSGFVFSPTGLTAPSSAGVTGDQSVTTKAYVDAQIISSIATHTNTTTDYLPIGSLIYLAYNTTDPSCWLYCNGQSVLRTTYSMLFAAIGATYGSVDSLHFNVPDFRGVFMRGLDDGANIDPGRSMGNIQSATEIADTIYMREPLESTVRNSDTGEVVSINTYIPALSSNIDEVNPVQEMTAFYKVRPDNIAVKVYIKYADSLSPSGNIAVNSNNIISTNFNGNITIAPNGTGEAILGYTTPVNARGIVPKQYVDSKMSNAFAKKTTTQSINATSNITFENGTSTMFATFAPNKFTIMQAGNYKIEVAIMAQNIANTVGCNVNILINNAVMSRSYYQVTNGYSTLSAVDVLAINNGGTVVVSVSAVGALALMILTASRIIISMV
jgi:microcystin-dependent protein